MKLRRSSVFLKLIGITAVTGILVNLLLVFGIRGLFHPPAHSRQIVERNVHFYTQQLAQEIGDPPDFDKAQQVMQRTGLAISIESQAGTFSTEPGLPTPNFGIRPPDDRPDRPYDTVTSRTTRYAFFLPERVRWDPGYEFLVIILCFVTGMLVISYFALRRLLAPLHDLTLGAARIGKGEIDHRVPVQSQDEFGRLAAGFNQMSERIQQMIRAKERLLLDVSHELQSPLARMKMALELLKDDKGRERLQRDVKEMEKMVAEILESARLDSSSGALQLQKVELVHLIEEQISLYQEQKTPVRFQKSVPELWTRLDPARFCTVLRNLIDNAVKYSEVEGPPVEVRLMERAGHLECSVRDFGRGIPPEDIPQLFEPFYRIDKSRSKKTGGYGLGLSLCDRIVRAHGGRIEVESGAGATFTVRIPMAT